MANPLLTADNVSKQFGSVVALRRTSLAVESGERVALVGANGSGKSTLLDIISGFTAPDGGAVRFNEENLLTLRPFQRARMGIARVFQGDGLSPQLCVYDHVVLGASYGDLHGVFTRQRSAERRKTVKSVLESLGLWDKRSLTPPELTYVDARKLALARAVAKKPKLLLLDELSSGLFETEWLEIADYLKQIRPSQVGLLFVEHNREFVSAVATRVVEIRRSHADETWTD